MATHYPSQVADRFLVRLPDGMREQLAKAAAANHRTMTKELVVRLQASFEAEQSALPMPVQEAIQQEMDERGGTPDEAHIRIALAAMAAGGTILYAQISPSTTFQQFREMLEAGKTVIPPSAAVVVERKSRKGKN